MKRYIASWNHAANGQWVESSQRCVKRQQYSKTPWCYRLPPWWISV